MSLKNLEIRNKIINFPVFYPDATRGVIRTLNSLDLEKVGIGGLIVNTYHLMTEPGASVIKEMGGIHKFMSWEGIVISDSGGFQLLSLIHENKSFGSISSEGVTFYKGSKGKKKKYKFTPEKCIQTQFSLNSDIMICLDDCPKINHSQEENEISVKRTIEWAKRCKKEFEAQLKIRKINDSERPLLFGVIQGGNDRSLRRFCSEELEKIGFDGYGFGGWPMNADGTFNFDILKYVCELMPDNKPKYALGVGDPGSVEECYNFGYNIFDCVLPTRDARHARLYIFNENFKNEYFYPLKEVNIRDSRRVDEMCDCELCKNFSKSYLSHLFKIEDYSGYRLATIHNLRTYMRLFDNLRLRQ